MEEDNPLEEEEGGPLMKDKHKMQMTIKVGNYFAVNINSKDLIV